MMARKTRTLTVSLPAEMMERIEHIAREERKTKSQLVRDMLDAYEELKKEREWQELFRYGEATARRLGITSEEEVQRICDEFRHGSDS